MEAGAFGAIGSMEFVFVLPVWDPVFECGSGCCEMELPFPMCVCLSGRRMTCMEVMVFSLIS